MLLQRDPVVDERVQAKVRTAGVALVLVGLSVAALARGVTRMRARLLEVPSSVWTDDGSPGSRFLLAGIALLDASDALHGSARPR